MYKKYKELIELYRVLFHLNDEGKVEETLTNIENLLNDIEEDIEVELVIHSKGVYPFKKDKNAHRIKVQKLLDKDVKISLCSNTLHDLHLELEDFIPGVTIVSSGVGEIVRRQKEGWLYIKP